VQQAFLKEVMGLEGARPGAPGEKVVDQIPNEIDFPLLEVI